MSKFDSITIGEKAEIIHTVTEKDVNSFASLTGDDNKLHMEDSFAKQTSFGKRVVHGMLSASFISTIIGTKLPGDGALWYSQSIEFLLPVRIGDEIRVVAEVKAKNERSKTIELQTDIFNQHMQTVITGTAKVKIIEVEPKAISKEQEKNKRANTALIIGATGGIGYATCKELALKGFNVIVHYNRNEEKAIKIKGELEKTGVSVIICKADICMQTEVAEMFSMINRKMGAIDVLINCSTIAVPIIPIKNTDWQNIQNHLDISVKGMFNLFSNAIPVMTDQGYGRIIALSTQAIETTPPKGWIGYVTAKSALAGLCKSMAVELASLNITVNMVSPGMTTTELIADMPEKARLIVASKSPIKRLANPEDIAAAICFLASEEASYITGETIRVNGGQVML
ncbi:MAG: SDR family oxidoreductase [Bacteroidota bacterium]